MQQKMGGNPRLRTGGDFEIGRRERIRTSGPYVPNVVLYQAELLSEPMKDQCFGYRRNWFLSGGVLIMRAFPPRNTAYAAVTLKMPG